MKRLLAFLALSAFLAIPAISMAADIVQELEGRVPSIKVTTTKVDANQKLVKTIEMVTAAAGVENLDVTLTDHGNGTGHISGEIGFPSLVAPTTLIHFDGDVLIPAPGKVFMGQGNPESSVIVTSTQTLNFGGEVDMRAVVTRSAGTITRGVLTLKFNPANPVSNTPAAGTPVQLQILVPNTKVAPPGII